jgi:Uma2 family endonuclease
MDGRNGMKPTSAKLTYDDFVNFPDDGLRHELIDGEHYVTPSPATIHQRLVGRLYLALGNWLQQHPIGEVFLAPFDVVLSHYDVVEPDLLVVLAEQAGIVTEKHVRGAPAIVVEVGSPGTRRRDEGIKLRLYERVGVREYWILDPDRRMLVKYVRSGDSALAATLALEAVEEGELTSALLPGFSVQMTQLFR